MNKTLRMTLVPLLLLLAIMGCTDSGSDSTTTSTTTTTLAIAETPNVGADGVVLAALLLLEGDVEQAVADARVTVAEVDAAALALENGTLDQWAILATE